MNLNKQLSNFSKDIDRLFRKEFYYRRSEVMSSRDLDFLIFSDFTTSCLGMRRLVNTEFERFKYDKHR